MEELWVNLAVSLAGTLVVVGIAWGTETTKRKALADALKGTDDKLAAAELEAKALSARIAEQATKLTALSEHDKDIRDLERHIERLESRKMEDAGAMAGLHARTEMQQQEIAELKRVKASVDMVEGLREAIGRIDGKLDALLRRTPTQPPTT